jgi:hypothetical protein
VGLTKNVFSAVSLEADGLLAAIFDLGNKFF